MDLESGDGPAGNESSSVGDGPATGDGPAAGDADRPSATRAARLFDLPAGERTFLRLRRVGVHYDDGGLMVNRRIPCIAEATEVVEDIAGTPRRLFVNLEPPIEGLYEIWLEDAKLTGPHQRPAPDETT